MLWPMPETDKKHAYLYETLAALVGHDTVTGRPCAEAMAYLARELERWSFRTARQDVRLNGVDQVNLVAVAGPAEPDGLVLSAHLDVVPFRAQPGWTRDALELAVDGDRVYGRGVADMKGFVAQILAAVATLDLGRLERPLVLAFTAEEEVGCRGAEALGPALRDLLAPVPVPRLVWIGEPTAWGRHHAHKGIVQFQVEVHGRGGHSSLPERGVNAIGVAARAVQVVGRIQEDHRTPRESWRASFPEAPYPTLNVGTIAGGTAGNMIPESCRFQVSYRPLPDEDPLHLYREIERRLAHMDLTDHAGGGHLASVTVDPDPMVVPGLDSAVDTPLIRALAEALWEAPVTGAPYATDGGRLAPFGLDALICGPGELSQAHQPDESLSRRELERGPAVIRAVIERLLF